MKVHNTLYSFKTFFTDKKKKYVRLVKIKSYYTDKKEIYYFSALKYDFGKDEEDIPYFIKAITLLFNEIILEREYSDVDYLQIKNEIIKNQKQLKKKWDKLKAELIIDHKGVVIQNYFQQIDEITSNNKLLLNFIYQPSMYGVFLKAKNNTETIFLLDNILKEVYYTEENTRYEILIKKNSYELDIWQ